MTTILDLDDRRRHVHRMWANVAPAWADYADDVDRRAAGLTQQLLTSADVGPGQTVLELASGPGGAGLAAAIAVGDRGHVVISDVVPEMVAAAAARARDRGLGNVSTAVLDLESIDRPAGAFDAVICQEGLMFAVEPDRALGEIRRVLRPGGRLAVSVWGPRTANPWLGIVADAVSDILGSEVPPPGMPGPFALADEDHLVALVHDAGFDAITTERVDVPLRSPSFESWWGRTTAVAGPLAGAIAMLDDGARATLLHRLRVEVASYASEAGIHLPGLAILLSAQR
jgi:ubiquinone/menaquinone biosynthesis C-methylase UbiE